MNLIDVTNKLQTEDQCLDFIEKVRWPDGKIRCVRCDNDKVSRITRTVDASKKKQNKRVRLYACLEPTCKHRFTPTVGTLFHDSHLPLSKWFMAVALIVHAKKGMSAKQVQRHLGVNYRTAWYMGHRIRKRGGDLRLFHIPDVSAKSLSKPIRENVSPAVEKVMTDEYPAYPLAMMASGIHGEKHNTIRHRDKIYVRGDVHTNTIESAFSLFKRGIVGSFHSVSGKHLPRYLSEFEYRFNRRKDANIFGQTVAHLVSTKEMRYRDLIAN